MSSMPAGHQRPAAPVNAAMTVLLKAESLWLRVAAIPSAARCSAWLRNRGERALGQFQTEDATVARTPLLLGRHVVHTALDGDDRFAGSVKNRCGMTVVNENSFGTSLSDTTASPP